MCEEAQSVSSVLPSTVCNTKFPLVKMRNITVLETTRKKKTYAQNYMYCTQSRAIALILYRKNFNYGAKSVSKFFFSGVVCSMAILLLVESVSH